MPSLTNFETIPSTDNHYQHREEFIAQLAPIAVSVLYFGGNCTQPQDAALYRQALFKLSFLYRHFLHPAGLRITVRRQVALLSGTVRQPALVTMAEILAQQIDGLTGVENDVSLPGGKVRHRATEEEGIQELLAATSQKTSASRMLMDDESLQALVLTRLKLTPELEQLPLQARAERGVVHLSGKVSTEAQKQQAEALAKNTLGTRDLRSAVTV